MKDNFGKTPLHYAHETKNIKIVKAIFNGIMSLEALEKKDIM